MLSTQQVAHLTSLVPSLQSLWEALCKERFLGLLLPETTGNTWSPENISKESLWVGMPEAVSMPFLKHRYNREKQGHLANCMYDEKRTSTVLSVSSPDARPSPTLPSVLVPALGSSPVTKPHLLILLRLAHPGAPPSPGPQKTQFLTGSPLSAELWSEKAHPTLLEGVSDGRVFECPLRLQIRREIKGLSLPISFNCFWNSQKKEFNEDCI